ncbi:Manganese/iron superoxide dismutase [Kalaharituber pfeilii]|nr:Manganese/iron superoxide dismutase [Kalaharituber pfeilii]
MSLLLLRSRISTSGAIAGVRRLALPAAGSGVRMKHTLPKLQYDYCALEPAISGKIMELHHSKHHQAYVDGLNDAVEKYADALQKEDVNQQIVLQSLINFHGGGHLNHSLFWENLAPKSSSGGEPPSGALETEINSIWGSYDGFKEAMNAALVGVQGSGWAWLVKDETGRIGITTRANQDPVVGKLKPLLGIDAWEHAYYLQYENRKKEYFNAIWDVINWKAAETRFEA